MFSDIDITYNYLKDCGIARPQQSVGKLYYWLNYLRVTGHLQMFRYNDYKNGFINTDINIIRDLFGDLKYFYAINDKLIADGFVEENKSYRAPKFEGDKNTFCKSYRLTDTINTDTWQVIKVKASKCSTTKKVLEFSRKKWKPLDHKMYNLLTQFWIDDIPFFDNTNCINFQQFSCKMLTELKKKAEAGKDIQHIYSFYKDAYLGIKHGAWRYTVDENGRRHTNLTNLPKILKPFLYVIKDGEKRRLKTIDVRNSQVLLLLTILPKTLPSYAKFKHWVETDFYQLFADATNVKLTTDNRTQIKQTYFTFIYGDNKKWYVWGSNAYKVMKQEFPDLVDYINELKNKNGYAMPANAMQKQESEIINNGVCKQLLQHSMPFAQVYDSILCLDEDIDVVMNTMTAAFNYKNLNVHLKAE
ncbi:MAG: hypothetical protein QM737_22690 [Ferruginibacter sp.]